MPITASCGNCGKTYQAPDKFAGKSVRCKACGEVFRIDAGEGAMDLDALEASVSGEDLPTHHASAMGGTAIRPTLDEHGRARIDRSDDVQAFSVAASHAPGYRSNYRFRYPGAKVVDQFLPPVLVLLTIALLAQACFNNEANLGEAPSAGVAMSRLAILLAAYLFVIWPASHIALKMAATKMRFSMPSAAVWRSFAAFTPVLLMGGWLFVKSGGNGVALAMGLLVGVALAIGAVSLLFRVFANEVPTVAGYVAAGSLGGATFSALAIVAINMIAVTLAALDKNPTLFVSPIAIGLNWIDKPNVPVAIAPKKPIGAKPGGTTTPTVDPAAGTPEPAPVAVAASPLQALPMPQSSPDEPTLLKSLELTPVRPNFEEVILPLVNSNAMGIIRGGGGGTVEVWDRASWTQPTTRIGQGFERTQGPLVIDTTARKILRLVRIPTDRLEQIPLGNSNIMSPVTMVDEGEERILNRTLLGFLNEKEVLIRSGNGNLAFERYDVAAGTRLQAVKSLQNAEDGTSKNISVDLRPTTVRVLPDGSGVMVACRDPSASGNPARLALYSLDKPERPEAYRNVAMSNQYGLQPLGMAVRPSARTALLLDAAGEGYLTVWEFRDTLMSGATLKAPSKPTVDRRLGVISSLRPPSWDDAIDPLLWIDEDTLLLYGNIVIDARTGRRLGGPLNVSGVRAQYPLADGSVLLMQVTDTRVVTLVRATFDPAALARARTAE